MIWQFDQTVEQRTPIVRSSVNPDVIVGLSYTAYNIVIYIRASENSLLENDCILTYRPYS